MKNGEDSQITVGAQIIKMGEKIGRSRTAQNLLDLGKSLSFRQEWRPVGETDWRFFESVGETFQSLVFSRGNFLNSQKSLFSWG